MYPLGMFDAGAADIDPVTGRPRRRRDGLDSAYPQEELLGIATGQPVAPPGAYGASQPTGQPPLGLYSSAGAPGTYAPADVTDPNHPFHALGVGVEGRKAEVRRKQELLDFQTNQQNPMAMPIPGSTYGADRFRPSPLTPAAPSALGILGPAIFNALGKLFAPQGGGGGGAGGPAGGSDDGPQYGGLY